MSPLHCRGCGRRPSFAVLAAEDRAISIGPRYAIYFVPPPDSDLYRFGSGVLGYDSYHGKRIANWAIEHLGKSKGEQFTRQPRRYGFHATLKAPFFLKRGIDERTLFNELDAFGAKRRPLLPTRLKLHTIGEFIALVPHEPSKAINLLAADCVKYFDRFRARMTMVEREKRSPGLSKRQAIYLARYGFPYILDEFRFHLTLTGRLPEADRALAVQALRKKIALDLPKPILSLGAISIARQNSPAARFRVIHQSSLGEARPEQSARAIGQLQQRISEAWKQPE
jgi:hypothetical protein